MDALVFETLQRINAAENAEERAQLQAESNSDLSAHFAHPANAADLEEFAFDLLNLAWADAMASDIVPQVIDVKTVGLGDPDYIDEDLRGLRAYWQGKGGQILSDIIRYERTQMPREEMVTALDFHTDEIALDFWGTFNKLVGQAQEKLRQLPVERLVELVRVGIAAGATYGSFAASTLTSAQIDSVLDEVAARTGGQVTILGSRVATRYLSRVGLEFGEQAKQQILNTGQIGVYKGYPVVQVENFENFLGQFVLPNNELWLVGRNAGRLTFYGAGAKVQQLRLPSFFTRWESARDAGMLLYGAGKGRIGRIVLT